MRVRNAAFRWVVSGTTVALLAVVLFVPPAARTFHFGPLHFDDLAWSVAAAPASLLWFEVVKRLRHRNNVGAG